MRLSNKKFSSEEFQFIWKYFKDIKNNANYIDNNLIALSKVVNASVMDKLLKASRIINHELNEIGIELENKKPGRLKNEKWSNKDLKIVLDLHLSGVSLTQIAKNYNICVPGIRAVVAKARRLSITGKL